MRRPGPRAVSYKPLGYVVQQNVAFYNNMTETEAYAQLVDTVNSSRFGGAVEDFRQRYGIKMSQAQFDALTSFCLLYTSRCV